MGKNYTVEYCFMTGFKVHPNKPFLEDEQDVYYHEVVISYELQETTRKRGEYNITQQFSDHKVKTRTRDGKDNVADIFSLINANLRDWVRADKINFSGYDIGN